MSQTKVQLISGTSSQDVTFDDATVSSLNGGALSGARNRIINGDMRIDQRNAGASITGNDNAYPVDRWHIEATQSSKLTVQRNAGSVTPPAGFTYYFGATSSSSYSVSATDVFCVRHIIEGSNIDDLGWGSIGAKTVTLSFWVRSSLTGNFGGSLNNSVSTYNYPFIYAINSSNTWEYKTLVIPGPTAGTWLTDTGRGMNIRFGLGVGSSYSQTAGAWTTNASYGGATGATSVVGTNGATFYITGVQLEVGSTATPFERRSYGLELEMCKRYFQKAGNVNYGVTEGTALYRIQLPLFPVMRTTPSSSVITGGIFNVRYSGGDIAITSPSVQDVTPDAQSIWLGVQTSGLTSGVPVFGRSQYDDTGNFLAVSAEL